MNETKLEFNITLDYIDEVIVLDFDSIENLGFKLEYIRSYFVNDFYSRNIKILKLFNRIIELYYLKNEDNLKNIDIELRELVLEWAKYEKTIS